MKKPVNVPFGSLCWAEYHAKDVKKSQKFYSKVLNWKVREIKSGDFAYQFFQSGDQDVCGMFGVGPEWKSAPYWNPYIAVKNVDKTAMAAVEMGGKLRIPPTDIPDGGRIACIEDPDGGVFSIFAPAQSDKEAKKESKK